MHNTSFRRSVLQRLLIASGISVTALGCGTREECFALDPTLTCPPKEEAHGYITLKDCEERIVAVEEGPERDGDQCCYQVDVESTDACAVEGRPMMVAGIPRTAHAANNPDWSRAHSTPPLSRSELDALANYWTEAALAEHASIASFSRFALELISLGAPPELLAAAHRAAGDEVRHARTAFNLASRYRGRPVGPTALALPAAVPLHGDLTTFALATFHEGCVNETLALFVAHEQHAEATDPAVRKALNAVIADESRHAELAWRTVRWALQRGGPSVARSIAQALEQLRCPVATPRDGVPAHGLLDGQAQQRALASAYSEVVLPCTRALLQAVRSTTVRPS